MMRELNAAVLRHWPLPAADDASDKEARGHVLIVAGGREIPGAALLAATAALRAGAGKLTIAAARSVSQGLALAIPEARVIGLAETSSGGPTSSSAQQLEECCACCVAALIGPGLPAGAENDDFVRRTLSMLRAVPVVLDASAMDHVVLDQRFEQPVLLTPHAGEMAHLTARNKCDVLAGAPAAAFELARRHHVVVALKGAHSYIAAPEGNAVWHHTAAIPGLATSGSGDVLAGIMAGVAARGANLEHAAAWGVVVHALAGRRLTERSGPLGFLARELLAEIPHVLRSI